MTTIDLREEFEAENGFLDDANDQTAYLGRYAIFLEKKFIEIWEKSNDTFKKMENNEILAKAYIKKINSEMIQPTKPWPKPKKRSINCK